MQPNATATNLIDCAYATAINIDSDQTNPEKYAGNMGVGMIDAADFLKCLTIDGCGNTLLDDDELCDNNNLGSIKDMTCQGLGYDFGDIRCASDCHDIDTTACRSILLEEIGLSGLAGSERRYTLNVDYLNATDIEFELIDLSSSSTYQDVDLFVQRNEPPSKNQNDCISAGLGSDELCTESVPGLYHVLVLGHTVYNNVSLLVTTNGIPKQAQCGNSFLEDGEICDGNNLNNVKCQDFGFAGGGEIQCASDCQGYITDLCLYTNLNITLESGESGTSTKLMVNTNNLANVTLVKFQLYNPTNDSFARIVGDADLYIRKGIPPTMEEFDCQSANFGNNELCTATEGGEYYLLVHAFNRYSPIQVLVTAFGDIRPPTPAPTSSVAPSSLPIKSMIPSISDAPTLSGFCQQDCTDCHTRNVRQKGCTLCPECELLVCAQDPYCCESHWDETWYVSQTNHEGKTNKHTKNRVLRPLKRISPFFLVSLLSRGVSPHRPAVNMPSRIAPVAWYPPD